MEEYTIEDFREDLINDIQSDSLTNRDYPDEVFIEYCKNILIEDYSLLSDLNLTYYDYQYKPSAPKFKKMHLDASYLETSLNTLNLLYCDYNNDKIKNINNEFINDKFNQLTNFFSNVLLGFFKSTAESEPVTQLAFDIIKNLDGIKKLHLIIISTNEKSSRLTTISANEIEIAGRKYNVDITLLDISSIFEAKKANFEKDKITIKTKDFGFEGIPCIKAEIDSKQYDAYLAIVPGKFLSDIYLKYSSRLLESNVRSFLNTKGKINKGILNTILNNKSCFFAYNNGISTTADDIELDYIDGKGTIITSFKNLQIINGGQTTASLANAVLKNNANLDGIYVQMKLSIIKDNDNSSELVRSIAEYANTQNKVTNADLKSNHPFYVRIKEFSDKIKAPLQKNSTIQEAWFFERARGQYDQAKMRLLTKKEREKFEMHYPSKKKFTKTDLAKYINSYEMRPFDVSWGGDVNMVRFQEYIKNEWEKDNTKFNELYFQELIGKAIMFKTIETIISNEEWYINNKGYRAQLVTYTFSKLMYEIKSIGKFFNFKKTWDKQELQQESVEDIKNISKLCFDVFSDPSRQYLNIGEYCKREICWTKVKEKPYNLTDLIKGILLDKEDKFAEEKSAKNEQKFNNEISNSVEIYNLGVKYWTDLLEKGNQLCVLNDNEKNMIEIAIKYCKFIYKELSSKQVKEIIQIKRKIEEI